MKTLVMVVCIGSQLHRTAMGAPASSLGPRRDAASAPAVGRSVVRRGPRTRDPAVFRKRSSPGSIASRRPFVDCGTRHAGSAMVRPPFYREAVTDLAAITRRARPWLVLMAIALALASVSGRDSPNASGGDASSAPGGTRRTRHATIRHVAHAARDRRRPAPQRVRRPRRRAQAGDRPHVRRRPGSLHARRADRAQPPERQARRSSSSAARRQAFRTAMLRRRSAVATSSATTPRTKAGSRAWHPLDQYAEMLGSLHSLRAVRPAAAAALPPAVRLVKRRHVRGAAARSGC